MGHEELKKSGKYKLVIFLDEKRRFTLAILLLLFIQGPPLIHSAMNNTNHFTEYNLVRITEIAIINREITVLYQFHDQKALFKVPKICNTNFWIENDPPPLWHFSKNSSDLVAEPFP